MATREIQKWHGAGNDFLVDICADPSWWDARRAREVCARSTGVGADGLIAARSADDHLEMTLFNSDGSSAEISGNGVRCLVAAYRRRSGDRRDPTTVTTPAGSRDVSLTLNDGWGQGSVDMGLVTLERGPEGSIGVARVGNPHVVVRDDATWTVPEREAIAAPLSAALGGANVEFASVVDRRRVEITVIERGAGWTLACGTGSVATVAVLRAAGEVEDEVVVDNPGGGLVVTFVGERARLGGPVCFVADVAWNAT